MASHRDKDKPEGVLEQIGLVLFAISFIIGLVWLAASDKIVVFWAPILQVIGAAWSWVPVDLFIRNGANVAITTHRMLAAPANVSLFSWLAFVNLAMAPLTILLSLLYLVWLIRSLLLPTSNVFRRFTDADLLLRMMSYRFTGVAPILHLRKALAKNTDPLWRRQTFPEEFLLEGNKKLGGQKLVNEHTGQFYDANVENYLKGIVQGAKGNGNRLVSTSLGRQIVDMASDTRHFSKEGAGVFADRMSDISKILFGMLVAQAFGGERGKQDYCRARDQLNNSCRGARSGMANITVAQWIYTTYRQHEMAHRLFNMHHWEYTYLFSLLMQAKKQGKCGHWEFLWLRPMNRTLWYVLNTVGRMTPHTEAAAAFNQHAFEVRCAELGKVPCQIEVTESPDGKKQDKLVPSIFVLGAVEGLKAAWLHWFNGTDDNDEWWRSKDAWNDLQGIEDLNQKLKLPTNAQADADAAAAMARMTQSDLSGGGEGMDVLSRL
ncbi:hypothetical protein QRD43_20955 [Pelomonas sp. APW6]|uniref:DotM C-terminal cytoplasmic domain-containing protein n=1 Tax=Roseateles subflavus TaxID=3053353 RepID=A0ABT7LNG2_9BURK|nr:hypothetical protein [Pelomonas sp. APW6]MDL5034385.1 hypothetical protein [Pelomonas sp. APW6]